MGNNDGKLGGEDDVLSKLFDQLEDLPQAQPKSSTPDLFGGATSVGSFKGNESPASMDAPHGRTEILLKSDSPDLFADVLKEDTASEKSMSLFDRSDDGAERTEMMAAESRENGPESFGSHTVILEDVVAQEQPGSDSPAENVDPIEAALQEFRVPSSASKSVSDLPKSNPSRIKAARPQSVSPSDFQDVFSVKGIDVSKSKVSGRRSLGLSASMLKAVMGIGVAVPAVAAAVWIFSGLQSEQGLAGYRLDGFSLTKAYVPPTVERVAEFEKLFELSERAMLSDEPESLVKSVAQLESILAEDGRNDEAASRILDNSARLIWWYGVGSPWSKKFDETALRLASIQQLSGAGGGGLIHDRARAQRLVVIGDYSSAEEILRKSLESTNAGDAISLTLLGELSLEVSDSAVAQRWLSKVSESDSPRVKLVFAVAKNSSEDVAALSQAGYLPARVQESLMSDLSVGDLKAKAAAAEQLAKKVSAHPTLAQRLAAFQGDLFAALGEKNRALEQWQAVVAVQPKAVQVLTKMARLNVDLERWDEALVSYRAIETSGSWSEAFALEYSDLLLKRGALSDALVFLTKASERMKASELIWTQLGRAQLALKQFDPARASFEKALSLKPKLEAAILGIVDVQIERKEWAEASARLRSISSQSPDYASALVSLGRLALMNGDRAAAEDQLLDALKRNPKIESIYTPLVQLLLEKGQYDEARSIVEAAEKVLPNSPIIKLARASYQKMDQRYDEALETVESLKKNFSHLNAVLEMEAELLIQKGRGPEAFAVIQQLARRASGSPEVGYLRLALFNSEAGKRASDISGADHAMKEAALLVRQMPEQERYRLMAARIFLSGQDRVVAQEHIDFALKRNPLSVEAWQIQGEILMDLGRFDEASKSYQRALELTRFRSQLYSRLADSFKQQGNSVAAVQYYQKVVRERPRDAEAHLELGKLLNSDGRFEAAIRALRRAAELEPRLAEAYYFLGFAQKETGNQVGALQSFEKFLSLKPSGVEAATIQDEVFFIRKSMNSSN